MSVLVDKNTRLLVQGISGKTGAFHTAQAKEYGTNVELGKKMLAESGLAVTTANDMADGARRVVALAAGNVERTA